MQIPRFSWRESRKFNHAWLGTREHCVAPFIFFEISGSEVRARVCAYNARAYYRRCWRPGSFFSGVTGLLRSGVCQIQAHGHRPRPALERLRSPRDVGVEGGEPRCPTHCAPGREEKASPGPGSCMEEGGWNLEEELGHSARRENASQILLLMIVPFPPSPQI